MYAFVDDPCNSLDVGCHERLVELLVEEARVLAARERLVVDLLRVVGRAAARLRQRQLTRTRAAVAPEPPV